MSETESSTITIKKSTYKMLIVVLVAALLGVSFVSGYFIGGSGKGSVVVQQPTAQQPTVTTTPNQPSAPSPTVQVSADDDPVKGDANAPIEIIEFSDFQCPFCSRWYTDTLPQL